MRKKSVKAPMVDHLLTFDPGDRVGTESIDADALTAHREFTLNEIHGGDLPGDLSGIELTDCLLRDLTTPGVELTGASVTDTSLLSLSANSVQASRAGFRDVTVSDSRLGAVDMTDAGIHGMVFDRCSIDFLNLRGAEITDLLFCDCRVGDLDLGQSRIRRLAFENCRSDLVDSRDAHVDDADLRGLEIGAVRSIDGLRGMTLSSLQVTLLATAFASHLGVDVRD